MEFLTACESANSDAISDAPCSIAKPTAYWPPLSDHPSAAKRNSEIPVPQSSLALHSPAETPASIHRRMSEPAAHPPSGSRRSSRGPPEPQLSHLFPPQFQIRARAEHQSVQIGRASCRERVKILSGSEQ